MADDKNNAEAKEASPFANTTFSFTAPQGGVSAPFPNLAGFSQALASAAQGAQEEEDDEPLAPEVQVRKKRLGGCVHRWLALAGLASM